METDSGCEFQEIPNIPCKTDWCTYSFSTEKGFQPLNTPKQAILIAEATFPMQLLGVFNYFLVLIQHTSLQTP